MPDTQRKSRDEIWENIASNGPVADAVRDLAVLTVETHVVGLEPEQIVLRIDTTIDQVTGDIKNTISEAA